MKKLVTKTIKFIIIAIVLLCFNNLSAQSISTTGTLNAFTSCAGTISTQQNFTISGTSLSANIIVTPPTGFEVSTSISSGYNSSVTLIPSSGSVSSTTIYLRLSNAATGSPSGNVTCASTGATTQNVAVSGVVNPTPAITNSSTASICSGTSPNITLAASTTSTFAWTLGTNTGSISGASANNGSSINQTLTNPSNASAGSIIYNVTPTSTTGSCVGSPTSITVTVNPTPAITNSSTTNICSGTSPNITLAASTTSTFAWTLGTNTGSISGASANSGSSLNQTLTNPSNASAGSIIYNVTPTSTTGSCVGSPTALTLTVNPIPAITNSGTATICSGTSPNLILSASAASTFAWTLGTNTGSISGASASNGSSINQTLTNPSNANAGSIIYNVTPTSTTGSCVGSPTTVTITVNPTPAVTNSSTASICSGTSPNITLTASNTSTFAWTLGTNTGSITGASANSGSSINQTLTNPSNANVGSIIYNVTPTSTTGSCVGSPTALTVTVNPIPAITNSSTVTICSGNSPNLTLAASAASTFAWTLGTNTGSITGASASNGSSINQTLTNPSNSNIGSIIYNITPTSITGSCVGSPTAITVTINPRPDITNSNTATICSGTNPNITLAASTISTFAWTLVTNSDSISGASASNGSTINQTLTNPSNANVGSIIYNVTPTSTTGSCLGNSTTITITVNPRPAITNSSTTTICNVTSTNLTLTASAASTFSWSLGTNTGSISGASVSNGSSINQTLTNPSNISVGSIIYNVTPTSTIGSCSGIPSAITLIVNPRPLMTDSNTQTVCSGVSSSVSLSASTIGGTNSFGWNTVGNTNLSGFSVNGSTSTIGAHTITNYATTAQTLVYSILPTFTNNNISCSGDTAIKSVNINPRPNLLKSSKSVVDSVFCSGQNSPSIIFSSNVVGTNYLWKYDSASTYLSNLFKGDSIGNFPSFSNILNQSNEQGFAYYSVTPFANNCLGDTQRFALIVNPKPIYNSVTSKTICTSNTISIKLNANTIGGLNSFNWKTNSVYNVFGNSNGIGDSLNQILFNPDSLSLFVKYQVIPKFKQDSVECIGDSALIEITVNPKPKYRGSVTQTICSGSKSNIYLYASTPAINTLYNWTSNADINVYGNSNSQSNLIIADIINNSNKTQSLVNYHIEPSYTFGGKTCPGNIDSSILFVNPLPDTIPVIGNFNPCLNSNDNIFYPQILQSKIKYKWLSNYASFQNGVFNDTVYIKWPQYAFLDTLTLIQTNSSTLCTNSIKNLILPTSKASPNTTNIKRIGNSDLLVCEDNSDSLLYQWGFTGKVSLKDSLFKNANLRYLQLPNPFDTLLNIYWVKTYLIGQEECSTKSYFNKSIPLNINNTYELIFELYPNPSDGNFFLEGNIVKIPKIEIFDSKGQLVNFEFDPIAKKIKLNETNPNGLYLFVFNNFNSVITKKIVITR